MATMVKDQILFGSKEHLESFRKALPFDVVPTNVVGVYATTDMAKEPDLATPSKTSLLRRGIVFRKPGATDRPGGI